MTSSNNNLLNTILTWYRKSACSFKRINRLFIKQVQSQLDTQISLRPILNYSIKKSCPLYFEYLPYILFLLISMLFPSKLLNVQDAIMRICLHNRGAPPNSEPLSSKKHYAKRIKLNLRNPGEVGKGQHHSNAKLWRAQAHPTRLHCIFW